MKFLQIIKSISVLFLFSVLASCGSSDDGSSLNASVSKGRVSLLITDGPIAGFDQINITLKSISFIGGDDDTFNGGDVEESDDDDVSDDDAATASDDTKEVIVFDEVKVINLLALQNYSDLLTTAVIPAGSYSKIRLQVSQVELVKINPDGTVLSSELAKLPGKGKIDLNPKGSFDVVEGEHLMIELDVDAGKSIHIVETGSGKFIFRPVIFVNILGEKDLKLVVLNGKVFASSETGFQLCKVEDLLLNDSCLEIRISENTVVQNNRVEVVIAESIDDNNIVTVLGKANSEKVNALHVVITAAEGESNNLGLFTGESDSDVSAENVFAMTTDDNNDLALPGTVLSVEVTEGARIYNEMGMELGADSIGNGSDVDVFGLAMPDLATVSDVKAAFIIVDNDVEANKVSGAIVAIDLIESEIIVSVVGDTFSGDVCINVADADVFLLSSDGVSIGSEEISVDELTIGMIVDIYGENDTCMQADVVLVTNI